MLKTAEEVRKIMPSIKTQVDRLGDTIYRHAREGKNECKTSTDHLNVVGEKIDPELWRPGSDSDENWKAAVKMLEERGYTVEFIGNYMGTIIRW